MNAQLNPGSVSLRNLHKSFGAVSVINDLSLDIVDGEFLVFVGPSGCGKSTLLRIIAGLEDISAGDVLIGGEIVTNIRAAERGVAMVFQSYALYPHMTVQQNMEFGLKISKTSTREIKARVASAAKKLNIEELLQRRPGQLSGGQRQRVAIGRAIVRNPVLFLFDEPLSNLDAELRVGMRREISRLHRELSNTMIYVTHDQTEAMTLADRIVVLRDGKIEQVGTPRQIYEKPENIFVAGFIGSPRMNFLSGRWLGDGFVDIYDHKIKTTIHDQALKPQELIKIGVRPEHLNIGSSGDLVFSIQIDACEYLGGTQYIYGQTSDGKNIIAEAPLDMSNQIDGEVVLSTDTSQLRFFDTEGFRLRESTLTDEALTGSGRHRPKVS